jgi:hypothetical protein
MFKVGVGDYIHRDPKQIKVCNLQTSFFYGLIPPLSPARRKCRKRHLVGLLSGKYREEIVGDFSRRPTETAE